MDMTLIANFTVVNFFRAHLFSYVNQFYLFSYQNWVFLCVVSAIAEKGV